MKKKQCFCGCDSFDIYQWDERKGDVMIKCKSCKCERRLNTPGCAAESYNLTPELIDAKEVTNE